MIRPKISELTIPRNIQEVPKPTFDAGFIVSKNAGWRTFKPIINKEKCVNCLQCYLLCPEGVIYRTGGKVEIDYDFCKGCGICAYECKLKAICMIKEEEL